MESILAEVTFLSAAEGGRRGLPGPPWLRPGSAGYMPHLVVEGPQGPESDYLGIRFLEGPAPSFGRPATFKLELMYPKVDYSPVVPGAAFSLREGKHVVATGHVLDRLPAIVPERSVNTDHGLLVDSLREALPLACQCQNTARITEGRKRIWSLPRPWLIENLPDLASQILDLNDSWEYLRLLEVLHRIDWGLLGRFIEMGMSNPAPEIREAAADAREWKPAH